MTNNVTATIKGYSATMDVFNGTDVVTMNTTVASKATAERECIAYCENHAVTFCAITDFTENETVKVTMDTQLFYAKAEKMDKRPNGAYISINVTVYDNTVLFYDITGRKAITVTLKTDTDNTGAIERKAKSYARANNCKYLKVISTSENATALYVMSVADFMKYGTVVEE